MSTMLAAVYVGSLVGSTAWWLFNRCGQRFPAWAPFAKSTLMPRIALSLGVLVALALFRPSLPSTPSSPDETRPLVSATALPSVAPTTFSVVASASVHVPSPRSIVPNPVLRPDLAGYPRPTADNGRGVHWFPTKAQAPEVVDTYVAELSAMRIKWLVFIQGLEDYNLHANDHLVMQLQQRDIMPVMRIDARVGDLDLSRLARAVRHYRALRVSYFQLYNEPNLNREWQGSTLRSASQFASLWLATARVVVDLDGWPGIAGLSPAGDANDEEYLRDLLAALGRSHAWDVLERTWLAVHNYSGGRPQNFVSDERGYARYRQYAAISRETLGVVLPLIGTEGGPEPASADPDTQARWIVEAYRSLVRREPYWFAYSPWLLGNAVGGGTDPRWESAAWFKPGRVEPVVAAVKGLTSP